MAHLQPKKLIDTVPKETQALDSLEKEFKTTALNMLFKELTEIMGKN